MRLIDSMNQTDLMELMQLIALMPFLLLLQILLKLPNHHLSVGASSLSILQELGPLYFQSYLFSNRLLLLGMQLGIDPYKKQWPTEQ